jgi:hypothetical protein
MFFFIKITKTYKEMNPSVSKFFQFQRWASYANCSNFSLQFSVALALFSISALTLREWGTKER